VTPYPLEGVVSWNMNTACNYRCSYCTQRFLDDRRQWAKDVPRFLDAFLALPGDWEIKLSGGEPFLHPRFLELVRGLAAGGRRVSVVTNLSAKPAELEAYAEATAARPGVLSASLHLEYVEPEVFLAKLEAVAAIHRGSVVATCVATRANLPRLPALVAQFAERGAILRIQPEKQDRDVIVYTPAERASVLALGGHNGTGLVDPSFDGQLCWAGARYFVADHRGAAWRCYPARRYKAEYLGNLLDGSFRLRAERTPCRYAYCNCTVPIQRGMVEVS
jgi:MoaA/NifB/PqqE/SkfB family radical SAM enzyme